MEHLYEELQDEGDEEEALPPRQAAWASRAVSVRSARSTTSQDPLMDAWHLLGGPTLFDELVDPDSAQVAVDLAKQGLSDGTVIKNLNARCTNRDVSTSFKGDAAGWEAFKDSTNAKLRTAKLGMFLQPPESSSFYELDGHKQRVQPNEPGCCFAKCAGALAARMPSPFQPLPRGRRTLAPRRCRPDPQSRRDHTR